MSARALCILQERMAACLGLSTSWGTCQLTGAPALSWQLCWAASPVYLRSLQPWYDLRPECASLHTQCRTS